MVKKRVKAVTSLYPIFLNNKLKTTLAVVNIYWQHYCFTLVTKHLCMQNNNATLGNDKQLNKMIVL